MDSLLCYQIMYNVLKPNRGGIGSLLDFFQRFSYVFPASEGYQHFMFKYNHVVIDDNCL